MRSLFFLFCFTVVLTSCATKKALNDCSRFKDGVFQSTSEAAGITFFIFRTDTLQTEYIKGRKDTVRMKVRWVEPCVYELTYLNTQFAGESFSTSILETKENYYVYQFTFRATGTIRDTIFQVNK